MAKFQAKVEAPEPPDFLMIGGLQPQPKVDIADLEDTALEEIGEEFKMKLLEKARLRREVPKPPQTSGPSRRPKHLRRK